MMPIYQASPLHGFKTALASCEAGGIEQFKTPIAHPTKATHEEIGYLPLHAFFLCQSLRSGSNLVSHAADMFHWPLRLYPEAAGIEGGVCAGYRRTPYQLAVDQNHLDYYLRLLLRAAPTLNPAEPHRLNYAERRVQGRIGYAAGSVVGPTAW